MNPSSIALSLLAVGGWAPVLDVIARATLLLAATGLASVVLRRASAATRHLVWTLGLLSALVIPLLTPTLPRFEVPLVTLDPRPESQPSPAVVSDLRSAEREASSTSLAQTSAAVPVRDQPEVSLVLRADTSHNLPWSMLLLGVWSAGTLLILGRLLLGHLLLRRLFGGTEAVSEAAWLPLARQLADDIGISRGVIFRRSPRATMPMACGLVRPFVLMPGDADDWPVERLRIVLLHELAHVKRRDCLTHALGQLACAVYWFNPLVWIAARHLRTERERACDDVVLAAGTRGSDYAEQLLEMARAMRAGRMPALAGAASLAMAHRSQLEGRLMAILDPAVPRAGVSPLRAAATTGLVTVALIAVVAVQPWAYGEPVENGYQEPVESAYPTDVQPAGSVRHEVQQATQQTAAPPTAAAEPEQMPVPPAARTRDLAGAVSGSIAAASGDGVLGGLVQGVLQGSFEGLASFSVEAAQGKPATGAAAAEGSKADPRLIEALTAAMKDVDKGVREAAMHALVQLRHPAVFDPLVQALKDSAADIREQAAHGLGQLRDRRAVGPLVGALKDENAGVREQVVFALGQLRDPSVVPALTSALKDASASVREQVVFALGQFRDPSTLDALTEALRDQIADVREQAAFALGQLRDRRSVEPLISALKDSNASVREQAAFALGQIRDKGAVEALVFALRDSSADVREQAAFALGQLRDPRAIDGLTAALKDVSASVRQQAAFALGQLAR